MNIARMLCISLTMSWFSTCFAETQVEIIEQKPRLIQRQTKTITTVQEVKPVTKVQVTEMQVAEQPQVAKPQVQAQPQVTRAPAQPQVTRVQAQPPVTRVQAQPPVTRVQAQPQVTTRVQVVEPSAPAKVVTKKVQVIKRQPVTEIRTTQLPPEKRVIKRRQIVHHYHYPHRDMSPPAPRMHYHQHPRVVHHYQHIEPVSRTIEPVSRTIEPVSRTIEYVEAEPVEIVEYFEPAPRVIYPPVGFQLHFGY